jgi:hypothetical protein
LEINPVRRETGTLIKRAVSWWREVWTMLLHVLKFALVKLRPQKIG